MKTSTGSKTALGMFHLLKAKISGGKFPHAIQFNITFRCNQRCAYCGIYNDTREEMTTGQICGMIDEFAGLGTTRLSITGGEPLLREDFFEVVRYARKKGLFVSLATNGSLVPAVIDKLSDVNSINLTLDGPEPIHDRQRGKGNFRKVLRAIELIRNRGIPVYVNSVLTKNNCGHLEEILQLAGSLDLKVLFQPVFFSEQSHASNVEGYRDTKYEDQALIETFEHLIELKEKGDPRIMLSKRYYREVIESIRQGTKIKCSTGGSFFCTISPDGRVAPCNLLVKDPRWLNGNEVGFRQAFMNMPKVSCEGCLSSFIDFDYLYSLKPDVVRNYLGNYLRLFIRKA